MADVAGINYDEIDESIRSLVRVLNDFPGASTIGSCGGHEQPTGSQADPGCWWVLIEFDRSDDGWLSLEFLGWAVRRMLSNGGACTLEPDAAPPDLNRPGHMLRFVLQRHRPVDEPHSSADGFAAELEHMRAMYFSDAAEVYEYEMADGDGGYLSPGRREASIAGAPRRMPDTCHPVVPVRLGDETADVDERMAEVVVEAFRAGIDTNGCCQDAGESLSALLPDAPHLEQSVGVRRGSANLRFRNRRSMVDFFEAVTAGGPRDDLYHRMMEWSAPDAWVVTLTVVDTCEDPDEEDEPQLDIGGYCVEFPAADVVAIADRIRCFNGGIFGDG
ncbi:MAG: hypothetical protein JJU45_11140 [Acidimicrobiia bacterium]|nr:hypothetical protein [Acidimicrobiia bacterium]